MGSCISSLIANVFVNEMETEIIDNFIKKGVIKSWYRYADDCIVMLRKDSLNEVFSSINSWDEKLKFTMEKMGSSLVYLDTEIFLQAERLEFKRFRKRGLKTVFSNFEKSLISKKYLICNIFNQLHKERDCSSTDEIFKNGLKILRTIFLNNSYPRSLLDKKINEFLRNDQKPPRPENVFTMCLDYTSRSIEHCALDLIRKIKKLLPNFHINLSYRSKKVKQLFSTSGKQPISKFENTNVIYKFECPCAQSSYVGMTERELTIRIREHQQPSRLSSIYHHIISCPIYRKKFKHFKKEADKVLKRQQPRATAKEKEQKFEYFKSQFSIIQGNFRSYFDRRNVEAYYIRVLRPDLNEQCEHRFFKLF